MSTRQEFIKIYTSVLLIIFITTFQYGINNKIKKEIKGQYLGQEVPGLIPIPFAQDILGSKVSCISFTQDGKEVYYAEDTPDIPDINVIKTMKLKRDGTWTKPVAVRFSGKYRDFNLNLSPDSQKIFFTSRRPLTDGSPVSNVNNIWIVERIGGIWGKPKSAGKNINTAYMDCYPSITMDGSIFFHRFGDPGSKGGGDLFKSKLINGKYGIPENIGEPVNTKLHELDVLVEPNEKWIIYLSYNHPDGLGMGDLFISFKLSSGKWSKPIHMGNKINSPQIEICPSLSPDGEYLFFSSTRKPAGAYWVSTDILQEYLN